MQARYLPATAADDSSGWQQRVIVRTCGNCR